MAKEIIYTEDVFMDSGAWALCRLYVLKQGKKAEQMGKHGRLLEEPFLRGAQGDFSYYDLTKGSPFRAYCDSYASFVRKFQDRIELFANIDAIGSPEITWEIQRFFEKEHGLRLVPVIHCGTELKWVEKYIANGYDIIGLGGYARKIAREELIRWTDEVFVHICPESHGYNPIVRVHGFALTAWEYMIRWPWYCVDSTSWVKYSAYGWIILPRWTETAGFRYDRPPLVVNMSWRSPFKADRHKHLDNSMGSIKENVMLWLKHVGVKLGKVDKEGNELAKGVISSHESRSTANLHYFLNLQNSLPKWPWPLSVKIAQRQGIAYNKGFGI
jgi:hypothetical protein